MLALRDLPYVEAARAVGLDEVRVMVRHVLPNALAPVIVAASITVELASPRAVGFEQCVRDGRAVDIHEGPAAADAIAMQLGGGD